jgi:hypothetical protein
MYALINALSIYPTINTCTQSVFYLCVKYTFQLVEKKKYHRSIPQVLFPTFCEEKSSFQYSK